MLDTQIKAKQIKFIHRLIKILCYKTPKFQTDSLKFD